MVNEIFEKTAEGFYHHFQLAHQDRPDRKLDDFHLVFVEIPKFRAQSHNEKKLMILWMLFMSEIEKGQHMISEELIQELQSVPEIAEALEIAKASGYTQEELLSYDKFWDAISREKTLISDAEVRGIEFGEDKLRIETVKRLKSMGTYSMEEIAMIMDMSVEDVEKI